MILAAVLFLGSQLGWAFESFEELRARSVPSEGILYDRNHEVLHELRVNHGVRQLDWTPLSLVSPVMKKAVLLSEDHRFWDHHGIDWTALLHAAAKNSVNRRQRGASTITMQLASFLDSTLVPKQLRRGVFQKLRQMRRAREIEEKWTKEQILEAYLNLVTFRGEFRGIAAVSYGLFSKAPHGLNEEESLILAALIRSPGADKGDVERRACQLGKLLKPEFECQALHALLVPASGRGESGVLGKYLIRPKVALAPHVASRFLKGAETSVTLDRKLQIVVQEVLRRQILSIRDRNVHDAAALVVDNQSGQVLAYVGGVGDLSSASYVDGVRALRQAGSTLKPFLYGLALDRRYLTVASLIEDTPLDIAIAGNIYRPKNYDNEFHGKNISVRTALASSLNVPAVKTLGLVGVESFVRKLEALGFEGLKDPDYYGPSLALGSADISLWELVNAYRTLSNRGKWSELQFELRSSSRLLSRPVFSPEAAFLVSDILSDRESRSLTFGLENALSLRFWAAVKTGTSKDMRDNWCIGFSDRYTVGVWVGNFSGEPMWNVTGVMGAAPAWSDIMKWMHRSKTSLSPHPPKSLARAGNEWFIKGTEPTLKIPEVSRTQSFVQTRITYPADGTVIARDPDIPDEVQRVFFESSSADPQLKWTLNGAEVTSTEGRVIWKPASKGPYLLSLLSPDGRVLHSVHFRVR